MNTKIFTKNELSEAAAMIRGGGIVAMPTETVYGLAANALNEAAVQKIFEAKGRQSDNPLIVHIANISEWEGLVQEIPPKAKLLAERFWPGPLTIVLKKKPIVPDIVSGGLDTVAVRMPKNKIAFRFIKECAVPIAAPSANLSGAPSPTKFQHVFHDLNGKVDGIIDGGDCMVGVESTVISLVEETPVILRPGRITPEQIQKVIGNVTIHHAVEHALDSEDTAASPGMKYKHYAPKADLKLVDGSDEAFVGYVKEHADKDTAVLCYHDDLDELSVYNAFDLGAKDDSVTQGKKLFDLLRQIDEGGYKKALAPLPENTGVGLAIENRLLRAAGFQVVHLNKGASAQATAAVKPPAAQPTYTPEPIPVTPKKPGESIVGLNLYTHTAAQATAAGDLENAELPSGDAILEEDSAILALSDVQLSADFNEDFSKEISDSITIIEKTSEEDPSKIFYEAVLNEGGAVPAAYPVDSIGDDFHFDVYDDDIEAERNKSLFSFLRKKRKRVQDDENEPEPFIPKRDPVWNADRPIIKVIVENENKLKDPNIKTTTRIYDKIEGIRVIGVTGKTGSGKTFIANKMAAKTPNSAVISADAVYHDMLEKNDSLILSLVIAFGRDILSGKKVNRKALATIAFSSEENLKKLNKTVLPAVAQEIISIVQHAKAQGVTTLYLDAPTLIESNLYQICDEIIFVSAEAAIRQERIIARDKITLDEIGQRMRFEKDDTFYVRYADRIIRNN